MTLRGADPNLVREALESGDPLPGTAGFAGELDGRLVRDVLGRVPLYLERAPSARREGGLPAWAFDPTDLAAPSLLPAGAVLGPSDPDPEPRWSLPDPDPEPDRDAALERLERAVETAAADVRRDDRSVAVAFSGGVDSALVAALLDAPLYVVGFPDSHDVAAARSAAAAMDRELTVVEPDLADLERAAPEVARAVDRTNAMDVGIGLPLYLVAERAAADGHDALALGQGADELFGGYEKVVRLDHRVAAETTREAIRDEILGLPDQLPRDVLAVRAADLEPVAPLLHDAVVAAALRLPESLLADEETRKRALRAVAREYVPDEVATREKKAVQYGSLIARELDRLARRAGYKRRIGSHVRKYLEARLAGEADGPGE